MFRHIIRFEYKNLAASNVLWMAVGLLGVSILFAVYNGAQSVRARKTAIAQVLTEEKTYFATNRAALDSTERGLKKAPAECYKDPANPITVGYLYGGRYAIMPPGELAAVSIGQSDLYPFYSKVTGRTKNQARNNQNFENPFNVSNGPFDLSFVLVFIFPLLIIALSYNLLSAEREQGTLKILLSQPLQITGWLVAKLTFRYALVVGTSIVCILLAFLLFGINFLNGAFPGLLVAIGLYTLFWFTLAFFTNLLGKNSATNSLILIGCWLLFVLIIPSVANMMATSLYPAPSRVAFVNAQRAAQLQADQQKEPILTNLYQAHPQWTRKPEPEQGWEDYWRENIALYAYRDSLLAAVDNQFQQQVANQQQVAHGLRFLSPAILMQNSLNEVAGTDTQQYRAFERNVDQFFRMWQAYFRGKFLRGEVLTTKDYEALPVYRPAYAPESTLAANFAGMLLFCGLFAGLSYALAKRRQFSVA